MRNLAVESSLSLLYQNPFIFSFLYAGFNFPVLLSSFPSSQFPHYFCLPCDVCASSGSFVLTQPAKIRGKRGFILPGRIHHRRCLREIKDEGKGELEIYSGLVLKMYLSTALLKADIFSPLFSSFILIQPYHTVQINSGERGVGPFAGLKMLAVVEEWIGQEGDVEQQDTFLSILSHNYSSEANLILKIQLDKSFGRRKGNLRVLALFMIQLNPCLFGYWVCWITAGLSKPRANPAVRSAESWRVSSRGNGSEPAVSVLPNQGDRDLSWSPFSTSLSKMQ